jgi:acyl-CoA thioesterase-1
MTCCRSWRSFALGMCVLSLAALVACNSPEPAAAPAASAAASPAQPVTPVRDDRNTNARTSARTGANQSSESRPRVVVLGDSLTAGLGLRPDEAYPTLLQRRLDKEGLKYDVVNAGVSGDTSAGGLARLDWALEGDVRVLIVALGGNDGLRGLPAEELKANLAQIIERAQKRHIHVILAGMEAPPNFGQSYIVSFHQIYPDLARQYNVSLVPFLLQGVAGVDTLNQRDGIHPTADGARIVANNIWPVLRPMLTTS